VAFLLLKKNKIMDNLVWRKYNGERILNINDYVLNYVKNVDRGAKVIVGCDSDNQSRKTSYAITVVFYNENRRDGAHVVYATYKVPKIKDIITKLWNEAVFVHSVAESLHESLRGHYYYKFEKNYYDNSTPDKLVEIHVDLNATRNTRNGARMSDNKSNKIYNDVMGWLCGERYKVMAKPYGWGSSSCADRICR
jgi:predicted RNase H-related nuclease YkuK (DUF458 family)